MLAPGRADLLSAPAHLPQPLCADWDALAEATAQPRAFDRSMLAGLPGPARRWLAHAIAPGTPLRRAAVFAQHGQIKLGHWRHFEADWVLAPPEGFIWAARTHVGPISIKGYDRYTHGTGEMRWHVLGHVPFLDAVGPDVDHSAMGRLAAEFCFVPAAALADSVRWSALDSRRATACIDAHGWTHRVTMTVGASGALHRVDVRRWDHPDGRAFREHVFTAVMDLDEVTSGGFTIAAGARAGWWDCPDNCAGEEFIRLKIDRVNFR